MKTLRARVLFPLVVYAVIGCGSQTVPVVDITGFNYAFRAPSTVPPGTVRLRFTNTGTVPHEVQVWVFKPGITADSGRALLNAMNRVPDSLSDSSGAVLIAAPHVTAPEEVYLDLQPDRAYALVCQFRDNPTAQRHDRLGMFSVFQVGRK